MRIQLLRLEEFIHERFTKHGPDNIIHYCKWGEDTNREVVKPAKNGDIEKLVLMSVCVL